MKVHIFRHVAPDKIDIGDVVLWDNDDPIEVESITRTKDGYDLTGHSRHKPGLRAVTMKPRDSLIRVIPNRSEAEKILAELKKAVTDSDPATWNVELINDLKPLVIRGKASELAKVTTATTGEKVTVGDPVNDAPVS
jgi:hypothetical protein